MTVETQPKPKQAESGLYISTPRIHPRSVKGVHRAVKSYLPGLLLALTALGPWFRWSRGPGQPDQAVLFSFETLRAYFFGLEIWAREFYYITAMLIVASLALFLATTLFGRIWCGFTCPQTVWTDLFVWVEKRIEGDRNARIRLDKAPWTLSKIAKKTAKHVAWTVISLITGAVFCFYFTDAIQGTKDLVTGQASSTLYGFLAGFAVMTYIMAGWTREQMCNYMCPWPRIQGAMLDEQSLIVSYDVARGEPRGHAKASETFDNRGHCVDCKICVQVCPVGIDIRNGAQMDCISCGLCIDGCNGVMKHMGLPPNLIGWKQIGQTAKDGAPVTPVRILRPRVLVYAAMISITILIALASFAMRSTLDMAVMPDRSPLFVRLSDGAFRNNYTVRLSNKESVPVTGHLRVDGLKGASISILGVDGPGDAAPIALPSDGIITLRLFIRQEADDVTEGNTRVQFVFDRDGENRPVSVASTFIAQGVK